MVPWSLRHYWDTYFWVTPLNGKVTLSVSSLRTSALVVSFPTASQSSVQVCSDEKVQMLDVIFFACFLLWSCWCRFQTCLPLFLCPCNGFFWIIMQKISTLRDRAWLLARLEPLLSGSKPTSSYSELPGPCFGCVLLSLLFWSCFSPSLEKRFLLDSEGSHKDLNSYHG